ncbi:Polyketide synthase PksN [Pseudobythopirellula maris]|uniref:Polyketide synthase PksN n=1 Tax=Pseudobythopirellula maris TaxID=2527991 RepID=A0A5C5ZKJ1_9BACT|nr:beta-ketoacyl synthase N-terminal-like domain-containing protein [Pseudobythopirellula maris]TWT87750.1 Polyketide synthase PksN [Pseudobythopirellula maris]
MLREEDIAIVGMSCIYPQADSAARFWSNVCEGVDAIGDVPEDRWPAMQWILGECSESHCLPEKPRGAFLPADLSIDPMKYGVLPNAVNEGDPDQFVMIKVVADALEDAGMGDSHPARPKTDLVVGHGGYQSGKSLETIYRSQGFDEVLRLIETGFPEMMAGGKRKEVRDYLYSCLPPNEVEALTTAMPNIIACRAANRLNLGGAAYLVDGACSSSLLAVEQAVGRLRSGQADAAVAGGIFLTNYIPFWHIFACLGALSPSGVIRPMDLRSDGLVVGEGAGAMVLKRLSDAVKDGDRVYSVIKGVGSSSNGRDVNVLAPSAEGQLTAMRRAYADAQVDPQGISYLELHGTGTVAGDTTEIATVSRFYGPNTGAHGRFMGSVKSMIGHAMPAAGMASLIKTSLALRDKVLPPSLHCEEPRPEIAESDFLVNTSLRPWVQDPAHGPRRAGVNAFGFGGINVHIVLEEAEVPRIAGAPVHGVDLAEATPEEFKAKARPLRAPRTRPSELYGFSGSAPETVVALMRDTLATLDRGGDAIEAVDLAATLAARFDNTQQCKAALVCPDLADLREQLNGLIERIEKGDTDAAIDERVFYAANAAEPEGKVAVVFPGNGFPGMVGEFPEHLRELALHFPEVREEVDFITARDRHPEDLTPLQTILWPPAGVTDEERQSYHDRLFMAQLDDDVVGDDGEFTGGPEQRHIGAFTMMMSNWLRWVMIRKLGMPVDMLAGLSLGEYTAVCAAGCFDYYSVIQPYMTSTMTVTDQLMQKTDVKLIFLFCDEQRHQKFMDDYPDARLAIAASPNTFCIAGKEEIVEAIVADCREEGLICQVLPYPPVHTEFFAEARRVLEAAFDERQLDCHPPRLPIYSASNAQPYPDDLDGIRELLYGNFVTPMHIYRTFRHMYDEGVRVFIQAGIGQISMLSPTIFPKGSKIRAVGIDLEAISPVTQFQRMAAMLIGCGVTVDLGVLFEHRDTCEVSLDASAPEEKRPREIPLRMDWSPIGLAKPRPASASRQADETPAAAEPTAEANAELTTAAPAELSSKISSNMSTELSSAVPAEVGQEIPADIVAAVGGLPMIDRVVSYTADQELVCERTFSLEEDRYLLDHLFIADSGLKPVEERWPVVPMTFSVEMFAQAGALLAPGLGLIGYQDVRMSRWIDVTESGPKTVRATARVVDSGAETGVRLVEVAINHGDIRVCKGVVRFAAEYRAEIDVSDLAPAPAEPWPFTAEQTYTDRRLFHGPMLRVLASLDGCGETGITGALHVLPKNELFASYPEPYLMTDPPLMDGISQLCGLWLQTRDIHVFPTGIDRIEFLQPTPPVGTVAPARFELREYNPDTRQYHFRGEVLDGAGGVWMRIDGWCDWQFPFTSQFAHWSLRPWELHLAEELALPGAPADACCAIVPRKAIRAAGLERAWRTALSSTESAELLALGDEDQQRRMVSARVAVKDAVRLWFERRLGVTGVHPAGIEVSHDEAGRPWVTNRYGLANPHVSLTHVDQAAVAIAADAPVGVDIEPLGGPATRILDHFATSEEQTLIESLEASAPGGGWATRFWTAKEAAGKLWGAGLDGRPKSLVVVDADPASGAMLVRRTDDGLTATVGANTHDRLAIAWASAAESLAGA